METNSGVMVGFDGAMMDGDLERIRKKSELWSKDHTVQHTTSVSV